MAHIATCWSAGFFAVRLSRTIDLANPHNQMFRDIGLVAVTVDS